MHTDCLILSIWLKCCKSYSEGIFLQLHMQRICLSGLKSRMEVVCACSPKYPKRKTKSHLELLASWIGKVTALLPWDSARTMGPRQHCHAQAWGEGISGPPSSLKGPALSPFYRDLWWARLLSNPNTSKHTDTQSAQMKASLASCCSSYKCSERQMKWMPVADDMDHNLQWFFHLSEPCKTCKEYNFINSSTSVYRGGDSRTEPPVSHGFSFL